MDKKKKIQSRGRNKRKSKAVAGRRKGSKRKGKWISLKKRIILVFVLILMLTGFLAARELFFYINESESGRDGNYTVKGVDVSSYQKDVDWEGLEHEGISFAFIKATEGSSHVDSRFAENWKNVGRTGIKAGAYHFMSYDTSGSTQAENFIKTVDRKWGMLPPAVDVEFYGKYLKKHPSKEKLYNVLDPLLEELEHKYGHKPVIYTNIYIYSTYISGRYDGYPVWISDPDINSSLPDGRNWVFCQYTFYGKSKYVAGGEKYVDMNYFNGSRWDLRKYDWK